LIRQKDPVSQRKYRSYLEQETPSRRQPSVTGRGLKAAGLSSSPGFWNYRERLVDLWPVALLPACVQFWNTVWGGGWKAH
jgi:hypothetical protein